MADIDVKFMKADKNLVKKMGSTYGKKKPKKAPAKSANGKK